LKKKFEKKIILKEKQKKQKKRQNGKVSKKRGGESLWITVGIHSDLGVGEQ